MTVAPDRRTAAAKPLAAATRHGRRHGVRPGISLLAQGEPLVWLTGGALVTAIAMILGLLVLVLGAGGSTFWPVRVETVTLNDGSQLAGELSRREDFLLTPRSVQRMPETEAQAARQLLGDRAELRTARSLYRVGNFELTQQHYAWIADYQRSNSPAAEFDPWMLVLERIEWGRFYGTLEAFQHQQRYQPGQAEVELQQVVDLLSAGQSRLDEALQKTSAEPLEGLRRELAELRRTGVADLVRSAAAGSGAELVLEDGSAVAASDVPDPGRVQAARFHHDDPDSAWREFERMHPSILARARQVADLTRHDVGRLGDKVEEARLEIRDEELRGDDRFVDKAVELANVTEELQAVDQELRRVSALADRVEQKLGAGSPLVRAAREIVRQLREEAGQQTTASREQRDRLQAERAQLSVALQTAVDRYLDIRETAARRNAEVQVRIAQLESENAGFQLILRPAGGEPVTIPAATVIRAYPANQLGIGGKLGVYGSRWWEFLSEVPREANSEGGVFPAIFGTVAMTLVMSLAVVPLGVLAALYLREYARGGWLVILLRIAINNLAGVPSIVFGVFGYGFFCVLLGAYLDGGPRNLGLEPASTFAWFLGLASLAVVAVVAFVLGIAGGRAGAHGGRAAIWLGRCSVGLWIGCSLALFTLIFFTPLFDGLFPARLPNPTFGKGGLLWSSLTLALLTLPVVIVATEEALSAVPNSMREGSYACGAGKWQTIRRIVLPQALPGIMTGMILAMARGAGEVAPLMLVGAVKVAPELPIDSTFPFVHAQRSYLHLGFHIFDLGFQSQNSEAAKPMVFTTTLLLIGLIAALNIVAVWLRGRLRKRFRGGQF